MKAFDQMLFFVCLYEFHILHVSLTCFSALTYLSSFFKEKQNEMAAAVQRHKRETEELTLEFKVARHQCNFLISFALVSSFL